MNYRDMSLLAVAALGLVGGVVTRGHARLLGLAVFAAAALMMLARLVAPPGSGAREALQTTAILIIVVVSVGALWRRAGARDQRSG